MRTISHNQLVFFSCFSFFASRKSEKVVLISVIWYTLFFFYNGYFVLYWRYFRLLFDLLIFVVSLCFRQVTFQKLHLFFKYRSLHSDSKYLSVVFRIFIFVSDITRSHFIELSLYIAVEYPNVKCQNGRKTGIEPLFTADNFVLC